MAKTKGQQIADMLVEYLESTGSLAELPIIVKELELRGRKVGLIDSAIVTSSAKLTGEELKTISVFVKSKFGEQYQIVEKVDPSLIAGFTVQVGDEVVDMSVATKLREMRKELV